MVRNYESPKNETRELNGFTKAFLKGNMLQAADKQVE